MDRKRRLTLRVLRLRCGQLPVVVGAAPAADLCAVSFADVLDESREVGYQRPIDLEHAKNFRKYIGQPGSSTIPLTFNLRGRSGDGWTLTEARDGEPAVLSIEIPAARSPRCLAQVDCQHRLGMMADSPLPLTFQCFIGLTSTEEMAIFSVINGKAKGLSSSLLDYHTTKLDPNLDDVHLELYIAKKLHDDHSSVWCGKVKLGGATQGAHRRISLRGLQVATKLLLQRSPLGARSLLSPIEKYLIVRDYWAAVTKVWPRAWRQPRSHLLTKGVGVTALSLLAGDIITAALSREQRPDFETFVAYLATLSEVDWSSDSAFKGYGGRQGASEAHQFLSSRLFAPGLAAARTSV